ncbi:interferon-inducible GTPase 5-like [Parambassis ranga]|uniref:Interferon-inducible GTPase 5-like n=1 Tax=Parambassis ranga TaxID=210632 RepID=A0A6P7HJH3_9TELE|nr:interferon-inducible GTPase 5-like [Parambassis ranga]
MEEEIKEALQNNEQNLAVEKINAFLEELNNISLNITVTRECGSGKSTFVNAFRGIKNGDEGAAPTGCVETTTEVTAYHHPNYPNVVLWDLPGIGTTNWHPPGFRADKYLDNVGLDKFDFFIIISATRFTENNVKLAREIQKMKKKFYFVRCKIDSDLYNEEQDFKTKFDREKTLMEIRQNCIQNLKAEGLTSPEVFLVSSFKLGKFDFPLLQKTLERQIPRHKRDALLFAMPTINSEIITKKKEVFQSSIKYHALVSAAIAAVPVPDLSFAVDLTLLLRVLKEYILELGLDKSSLERLAASSDVPYDDLRSVIKSPLAAEKITCELILKALTALAGTAVLMAAEEGSRFIPIFGIPVAMGLSFTTTYRALNHFLDVLAEDAQRVFIKALGVDTSV